MKNNIIILILLVTSLCAQFQWYNHSELNWETIETKHFRIHYHQGTDFQLEFVLKNLDILLQ